MNGLQPAAERRPSLARGVSPWNRAVFQAGSPGGATDPSAAPPGLAGIRSAPYQGLTPLANDGRPSGTGERRLGTGRRGFTLVELLVVVSVIIILAGLVLGALESARRSAREAKTKATITKLHNIIMQRYLSYGNGTRRVPINTTGMTPFQAAQQRLWAIRDIMRMEMPECPADVENAPRPSTEVSWASSSWGGPSLYQAYRARYYRSPPSTDYNMAEMFYMFVTMGDPEAREQFSDSEVGDTDNDGWPEFIDAWGNPIMFLRWAPAFTDSDIQTGDANTDHDPLDTRRVESGAYRLVPLIYSAGPDGIYDIAPAVGAVGSTQIGYDYKNPYAGRVGAPLDLPNLSRTAPGPANNSLDHYDNIHNHRIEAR